MRLLKLLLLFSLFTSTVFSQVIIREKVEVKPRAPEAGKARASVSASNHPQILVDSYVSAHVSTGYYRPFTKVVLNGHTFYDHTPARSSEFVSSLDASFEVTSPGELTADIAQFVSFSYVTPPADWIPFDIVTYQQTMVGVGAQYAAHSGAQLVSDAPYQGLVIVDYTIDSKLQRLQPSSAKATIGPGELTTITLEPIPSMSPGDIMPVTVTVDGPCHIVINGVDYGKAWVGQWGDVKQGFQVIGDADPPDGETSAIITVDTRLAIERIGSVTITVKNPFCVKIIADKSPLAPGDTTLLTFKKIRSNGDMVDFPAGQPFDISLAATDSSKGLLLSSDGGLDIALPFASQPIYYLAPATLAEDSVEAFIVAAPVILIENKAGGVTAPTASQAVKNNHARASNGLKKLMENISCPINKVTVVAEKPILKILDHSPWTIWPSLPPQNRPAMSRGADQPSYNPKRGFLIKVIDRSNNPLVNQVVKIFTHFEEESGGHIHGGGTTELPQSLQGKFSGQGNEGNPLQLITDANGEAVVDEFQAPEHSGKYLITVSLKTDATVKDTVNLVVKVPGLVNLRNKIIEPTPIWMFSQSESGAAHHPDNNWCKEKMADSVFLAIASFYDWTVSEEWGGSPVVLSLNDMSLEYGGHFDIDARWTLPKNHSLHRSGLSVDINNAGNSLKTDVVVITPEWVYTIKIWTRLGQQLIRSFRENGGTAYNEGPIHFEFKKSY